MESRRKVCWTATEAQLPTLIKEGFPGGEKGCLEMYSKEVLLFTVQLL